MDIELFIDRVSFPERPTLDDQFRFGFGDPLAELYVLMRRLAAVCVSYALSLRESGVDYKLLILFIFVI